MDREKEIEELKALLLEKSSLANIEPVFTDENGNEYTIDNQNALKVLNDILEQAFIPFIAEQIINAGYGNVKKAVEEFVEQFKEAMNEICTTKTVEGIIAVDRLLKKLIKELYGEDEK